MTAVTGIVTPRNPAIRVASCRSWAIRPPRSILPPHGRLSCDRAAPSADSTTVTLTGDDDRRDGVLTESVRRGEPHGLQLGRVAGEGDLVVHELGNRPAPDRSDVEDLPSYCLEQGPAVLRCRLVAADHDRHRPELGLLVAAVDRGSSTFNASPLPPHRRGRRRSRAGPCCARGARCRAVPPRRSTCPPLRPVRRWRRRDTPPSIRPPERLPRRRRSRPTRPARGDRLLANVVHRESIAVLNKERAIGPPILPAPTMPICSSRNVAYSTDVSHQERCRALRTFRRGRFRQLDPPQ